LDAAAAIERDANPHRKEIDNRYSQLKGAK